MNIFLAKVFSQRVWSVQMMLIPIVICSTVSLNGQKHPVRRPIQVEVTNLYGEKLKNVSLMVNCNGEGWEEVSQAGPSTFLVPACRTLRVSSSLHNPREIDLSEFIRSNRMLVALAPTWWGENTSLYSPLTVKVVSTQFQASELVLRAVSLYGPFSANAWSDAEGQFEMENLPDGEYLVLIIKDNKVLKEVRIRKDMRSRGFTLYL